MGMKWMVCLMALTASFTVFAEEDMEALAGKILKERGVEIEEPAPADPASGFWTCRGVRLHMGVDLTTLSDLDTGDMWVVAEKGTVDSYDKHAKIKGTYLLFNWAKNPAVTKFFVIDKSGKNLYLTDDLDMNKYYRCKRDK